MLLCPATYTSISIRMAYAASKAIARARHVLNFVCHGTMELLQQLELKRVSVECQVDAVWTTSSQSSALYLNTYTTSTIPKHSAMQSLCGCALHVCMGRSRCIWSRDSACLGEWLADDR